MPESITSTLAVATAVSTRAPASAASFTSASVAACRGQAEYPWWRPDRRPGEVDIYVKDDEIDVFFEEPIR